MQINELQQKIDDWIKKYGVRYFDILTNNALLMEEVGEVSRIIARKYGEQSNKSDEEDLNLAEELGDVLFVLVCIANQTGIDLEDVISKNLEKKTSRDANRHQNNKKINP